MSSNCIRFFLFVFVLIVVSIAIIANNYTFNIHNLNPTNIKVYFQSEIGLENLKTLNSGAGCYINCSTNNFDSIINKYSYSGFTFNTKLSSDAIINNLNAKIVSKQKITINNEKKLILYCYFNKFDKFLLIDNQKVNLQIVVNSCESLVGIPIILGSY